MCNMQRSNIKLINSRLITADNSEDMENNSESNIKTIWSEKV